MANIEKTMKDDMAEFNEKRVEGGVPTLTDLLFAVPKLPQRQDSTSDQMRDLWMVANKLGMYDAADLIKPMRDIS